MLDAMDSEVPITRDDFRQICQLTPVRVPEDIPAPERLWSDQDWLRIRHGYKPDDDDRWYAYVEGQRLFLHRIGGRGIYEAQFVRAPDGWQISSAVVEGDRSTYRRGDDAYESASLEVLIESALCGVYDGPGLQRLERLEAERETPQAGDND